LIYGPTQLEPPKKLQFYFCPVCRRNVSGVMQYFPNIDIAIFSAAVADFTQNQI
jgi:hypothetical protein